MAHVESIYRYPVKGLSAEPLRDVALTPGGTLPFDRAFAIENGPSGFDPAAPKHFPKIAFLMLMRHERLAALTTRYDDATSTLVVYRDGKVVAIGNLDTPEGRRTIEGFFDEYSADDLRGPARVLSSPGHSFSDTNAKVLSLINLATVAAIGNDLNWDIHPLRFRGNLHVEGLLPWQEFDWIGKTLTIGGVTFEVTKRIDRCAATNVDPVTAARDLTIPHSMLRRYAHADCGVYLKVVSGGTLAVGDSFEPPA